MAEPHPHESVMFDEIAESALLIAGAAAVLHIAATARDSARVEAYLWGLRRELKAAIETWRQVVPPFDRGAP